MSAHTAALANATARVGDIRRQLRQAQKKLWDKHSRQEKVGPARETPRAVAVCLYLMENAGVQPALAFLRIHTSSYSARNAQAQESDLENWARAVTVEPCADHPLHPTSATGKAALQRAHEFVAEHHLVKWVQEQNASKGLTPSARHTVERYVKLSHATDTSREALRFPKTVRARFKWVQRWSARWGVRRGQFKPGERLTMEQRRKKVSPYIHPKNTVNGIRGERLGKRDGHFLVTILGPENGRGSCCVDLEQPHKEIIQKTSAWSCFL